MGDMGNPVISQMATLQGKDQSLPREGTQQASRPAGPNDTSTPPAHCHRGTEAWRPHGEAYLVEKLHLAWLYSEPFVSAQLN